MDLIPNKLKILLHGVTDEFSAAVGNSIALVSPILQRNEAIFFPDYTDHGICHVKSVLTTCELLISDEAWSVFTREDAATLILSVVAHDLGMLIDIDGFQFLLKEKSNDSVFSEAKDKSWQNLWRDFRLELRRFSGAKLQKLFGTPDPISDHELIPSSLADRGIRAVGEFLRRHHHRLAHEIVISGFPSGNGRVPLFHNAQNYLQKITGLIARSHGIPLRDSIEFLKTIDYTSHREYRHIHPLFLMTLVRIADYLDLDIGRAPASILSAKSLRSPISKREWWSHRAIVDCHSYDEDPECLRIVVEPAALPDVSTFSVVEDKISGIQGELDSSWAVIGETYGRFPPLNKLTLRIRRIRSDLREESKIKQLPFVPHRASLKTAKADLLKLLIEPLYGDHPGIGLRELMQNSIDAVREIEFVIKDKGTLTTIDREDLKGDVTVELEKDNMGDFWVIVADRGIGMTWDTVANYYLTAGASYRQSDAWKRKFTDTSGSSQIIRAGRFGIGILAAFLLGDRVSVSTRHAEASDDEGVYFEFGIDDEDIEMRWVKKKVGTTVKVKTNEAVIKRLMQSGRFQKERWDWYCLESPVLIRKDPNNFKLKQRYRFPGLDDPLPKGWHRIDVPGLQAVDWSYRFLGDEVLSCNGIFINKRGLNHVNREFLSDSLEKTETNHNYYSYFRTDQPYLNLPTVSIFDPDGRFPLNLARDDVASPVPEFMKFLVDDICRNFIAFSLICGPQKSLFKENYLRNYVRPNYPGISSYRFSNSSVTYFYTRRGFGLVDPWNISHFVDKPGLIISTNSFNLSISNTTEKQIEKNYSSVIPIQSDGTLGKFDSWHRRLSLTHTEKEKISIFKGIAIDGVRTLFPIKWYNRFIHKQPMFISKLHTLEKRTDMYVVVCFGKCKTYNSNLEWIYDEFKHHRISLESISEFYFKDINAPLKADRIAQSWENFISKPIIPFNSNDRKILIDKLEKKMSPHLNEWRLKKEIGEHQGETSRGRHELITFKSQNGIGRPSSE